MELARYTKGRAVARLASLVVAAILGGCAGTHLIPPADYAEASENNALRVVFDQDGNIYPRTADLIDWVDYRQPFWEPLLGNGFQLTALEGKGVKLYAALEMSVTNDIITRLNKRLASKKMLIVLIHGFNNDFSFAAGNFGLMNARIDPAVREQAALLEVFWDGLDPRRDGLWEMTAVSFWRKALTYSNRAGIHGLRTILNGVDKDVDVRFVTHSRGIGVVMSALADPVFDRHIHGTQAAPLHNPHLRSIKIAAFAPAIGNGHLDCDLNEQLTRHPVELFAGINRSDFATSKLGLFPAEMYGASNLGSDVDYVRRQIKMDRKNFRLRAFEFTHGAKHGLSHYFANDELTTCMFGLLDLRKRVADSCSPEVLAN
ncbi:alpha/beta hydrolase [Massilia sp. DJPM01]|uniref:alpha/beta hydrolase n=1 Tax=Massilia sp. DJPM01 TaxID=3024404 RepID=UPI00259F022E|nr:alpha/beta hydrolase [Massilia sp. DJPM01]MDM5175776.1 alpha/beta hydrolase [Massilia sp. DJPM01]